MMDGWWWGATALLVALAWRALGRRQFAGHALIRRDACLPGVQVALWRRTGLCSHDDGFCGQSFPSPVETRTLALVACGLILWTRRESIGLPIGSEARFDDIGAADFDRHFTAAFSALAPRRVAIRRLIAA